MQIFDMSGDMLEVGASLEVQKNQVCVMLNSGKGKAGKNHYRDAFLLILERFASLGFQLHSAELAEKTSIKTISKKSRQLRLRGIGYPVSLSESHRTLRELRDEIRRSSANMFSRRSPNSRASYDKRIRLNFSPPEGFQIPGSIADYIAGRDSEAIPSPDNYDKYSDYAKALRKRFSVGAGVFQIHDAQSAKRSLHQIYLEHGEPAAWDALEGYEIKQTTLKRWVQDWKKQKDIDEKHQIGFDSFHIGAPTSAGTSADRGPKWSRDELLLALEFYLRNRADIPGKKSAALRALSKDIEAVAMVLQEDIPSNRRRDDDAYSILMTFGRFDSDCSGRGLGREESEEQKVWSRFANSRDELSRVVKAIKEATNNSPQMELQGQEADEVDAEEGRILTRVHRYRERDGAIVARKKKHVLRRYGKLQCEACGFDFEQIYGERGKWFIECHHTKAVSELTQNQKTKLSDLVLVCSNCHRMIHRMKPWLSLSALKELLLA